LCKRQPGGFEDRCDLCELLVDVLELVGQRLARGTMGQDCIGASNEQLDVGASGGAVGEREPERPLWVWGGDAIPD
jgi:hypothetical protein